MPYHRAVFLSALALGLVCSIGVAACSTGAVTTPSATAAPVSLLVLHTNDNWGETEPCG